jgi:hypothetical protein
VILTSDACAIDITKRPKSRTKTPGTALSKNLGKNLGKRSVNNPDLTIILAPKFGL